MSDPLNVMDYIPTGLQAGVRNFTNTTPLNSYLAAAYSAASTNGAEVYHPAGAYLIDTSLGTLTVQNVTLRGSTVRDRVGGIDHGSIFYIKSTANPAFTVQAAHPSWAWASITPTRPTPIHQPSTRPASTSTPR